MVPEEEDDPLIPNFPTPTDTNKVPAALSVKAVRVVDDSAKAANPGDNNTCKFNCVVVARLTTSSWRLGLPSCPMPKRLLELFGIAECRMCL